MFLGLAFANEMAELSFFFPVAFKGEPLILLSLTGDLSNLVTEFDPFILW